MKRALLLLALVAVVTGPFLLRPKAPAAARADDTVVVVTSHNEAIRHEFGRGFVAWYRAKTGRTAAVDWRALGGTSEIVRHLESEYTAAFRQYWTSALGRPWSAEVLAAFANPRLATDALAEAREARRAFLESTVGCGFDVFCGGGSYDYVREAQAGRIVPARVLRTRPEWFTDEAIPRTFAGETYWDDEGRWFGNVLSSYGILCNRDSVTRLGLAAPPQQWADLADPRLAGEVALCDPTKSSSMAKAFENMIQQQMQQRLVALRGGSAGPADPAVETRAVREGWREGLRLIQAIAANARYFTDSSQKPPIDVAQGNCAAGVCIDFYGRAEAEAAQLRRGGGRLEFVTPAGGTVGSVDPVALLRGAPHRDVAEAFIEYTLAPEGQKLWNFKPGTPGGPERFALRRLPVRRDFYAHAEWKPLRSDPAAAPFDERNQLIYRPAWTAALLRELAFVVRVACLDPHPELTAAWREIHRAGRLPAALDVLGDLSAVDYDEVTGRIKRTLNARDKVDELRLANELANRFRAQYLRAAEIARKAVAR
jgi:ABC-type Fe3+ transport system substrate-binding protein